MPWFLRIFFRLAVVVLLIDLYGYWSLTRAVHQLIPAHAARFRLLLLILLLWANALPVYGLIQYVFFRQTGFYLSTSPLSLIDYLLVFPYWILLIVVLECIPYLVVLDGIQPLLRRLVVAGSIGESISRLIPAIKLTMVAVFLVWVPVKSYVDTYRVQREQHTVPVKGLPRELNGLRLTLLSDVQVDRFTGPGKLKQVSALLREHPPDVLLFAGDLVTWGEAFIPAGLRFLCSQAAALGRVACLGDHDVWSGPHRIADGLRKCGWQVLDNQHQVFASRGARILVTGLTHVYSRRLSSQQLEALLATAPDADLKIVLVHQPAPHILQAAARYGYQLVVAGHTHGGQVLFHPFGKTVAISLLENHFFRGIKSIGTTTAVITNGVGLTFVPLRYGARATVTELTLSSQ